MAPFKSKMSLLSFLDYALRDKVFASQVALVAAAPSCILGRLRFHRLPHRVWVAAPSRPAAGPQTHLPGCAEQPIWAPPPLRALITFFHSSPCWKAACAQLCLARQLWRWVAVAAGAGVALQPRTGNTVYRSN